MAAPSSAQRPRLWVPGVAYVTEERELDCGRHAGFNGWGKAFRASPCGHFGSIRQWRHRIWLVDRAELDDKKIAQHAIILPETLLDPDLQPHARRWLAEQPLLCVSGLKIEGLTGAGLRVYQVEHGVEGEGVLAIGASGGGRAPWMFRGRIADMIPLEEETSAETGLPGTGRREERELIDRLLNQLTRGVLREQSVVNAMSVRILIEPGYGYRGELAGVPASIDEVQSKLRGLEALFRQIYERAEAMRADARELARSVKGAASVPSLRELPIYGGAVRVDAAEVVIRLKRSDAEGPLWEVGGEPREELVLPFEARWVVERVSLWSPKLPADLAHQLEREEHRGGRGAVLVLLLVILVVGALVGVWLAPEIVP